MEQASSSNNVIMALEVTTLPTYQSFKSLFFLPLKLASLQLTILSSALMHPPLASNLLVFSPLKILPEGQCDRWLNKIEVIKLRHEKSRARDETKRISMKTVNFLLENVEDAEKKCK
jgi:hypothetical protein